MSTLHRPRSADAPPTPPSHPPRADESCEAWLQAAIAAADALARLHQSGIIHQNIRPDTLRIGPRGENIELTGAAMSELSVAPALKMPLEALPYIAPEQTGRLEGDIDQRADLYSLGVVLYERRAGTLPFHADDAVGWVHCHVARAPRPLVEAAPGTPETLSEIVMKLLAKSPDDRYQSARGLQHDLERCLSELSASGRIEPFALGAHDVWDKLRAATRMFGRSEELATLEGAVESVRATGGREVVLITGPSGIGKSVLVRELQRRLGGTRASLLWGTFERHKRDIPHATLGQAFQDLIRQTVALPDAELASVREQLKGALGDNGQLIIDLVPQLELVLDKQPPAAVLPGAEARNRFHMVFRNFLGVFATRERPLVLFLDDLQWADAASLELVQHVVTHPDVRSLIVLGAYRDDEVDSGHPLEATLKELHEAKVPIASIRLGPLPHAALLALVVDVMRCKLENAKPLASLLWAKTSGNPFFAVQLLSAFHQEHLIRFDARKWAWHWDIAELEGKGITDDMVELVLDKFCRLPKSAQDVLKLAACVGSEFSVDVIGTLYGTTPEEVRDALEPALTGGLLLQRPQGYKFLHDRVQQAAYGLIPEQERSWLHLRLGWLLLARMPEAAAETVLFDIVNQLNLGVERVEADEERRRIAELNLRAGRKAKAASAAKSAATYLAAGVSLLAENAWEADYALAYALHLELAECEFLSGRFDEAERLAALVVAHAQSKVDQAAGYRIQIHVATAQGNNARAIKEGLSCLRILGVELPEQPNAQDVEAEIAWIRDKLQAGAIEALIHLPDMTDSEMIAATDVLSAVHPAAAYLSPHLAQLVIARLVRLSIEHGNAPASVHGYVSLGHILCSQLDEYRDGYRFGKLACELGQRPRFSGFTAEAIGIFGGTIVVWSCPMQEALDHFRVAFRLSRDSGKLLYATINQIYTVMTLFVAGEPLDAVHEASVAAVEFATTAKYGFLADNATVFQRVVGALRGDAEPFGAMGIDGKNEQAYEAYLLERSIPLIRMFYYTCKLTARFFAHDYRGAHAAATATKDLLWSSAHTLADAEYCFYAALTAIALCEGAGESERASLRSEISACEDKLRRWAENCPDNFAARHTLVTAEIARIDGRDNDAAMLYDQAIRTSSQGESCQIEGLACELAGRFYLNRAFAVLPSALLRQARACYARWGAFGKVRHIDTLYATHVAEQHRESGPTTHGAEAEQIDTVTATRASEAISSEMAPEELLATLMRILIEHAGAQRACLLLPSPAGFNVAAEIISTSDGVHVAIPKQRWIPSATDFPLSVAHYVRRTREKLILDDVATESMFTADAYISGTRPKSLLCAPIVRRNEVSGILYLENRLARGAFTPRRLALLEFLSAISLENALLAADLEREMAVRTRTEITLQQSEERLQRLVETANVMPWQMDRATGRFTYVGRQVVKMLGYPHEAWLTADFLAAHVHPDDRERTEKHLAAPSVNDDFDFRMIAADGRTVWLHNVVSTQDFDGTDVGGLFFDVTERKQAEATLKEKLDIIEAQQTAIRKLSTPIIEVWEGVVTMPVLGVVDEQRAEQMMTVLLNEVTRTACRYTIIDLTGVESVDTRTADHIMRIVRAVQLLGAQSIVVGIRPEVAQTIVSMGIHLSSIVTLANLREALVLCMRDQQTGRARPENRLKR